MANCTQITDSNGNTRDICDQTARDSISQISGQGAFNLDELTTTGLYYCASGSENKPGTRGGGLLVIAYNTTSANSTCQLFIEATTASPLVYYRVRISGVWREWAQL